MFPPYRTAVSLSISLDIDAPGVCVGVGGFSGVLYLFFSAVFFHAALVMMGNFSLFLTLLLRFLRRFRYFSFLLGLPGFCFGSAW